MKFFTFFRHMVVCMKTRYIFFLFSIFVFATFQRKSGILILDLYLYSVKMQTNIKQNW
jgi:hypothetical protein